VLLWSYLKLHEARRLGSLTLITADDSKQTALHFAVSKQNTDVVKLLLSAPHKANTRIRDIRQQMPIHRAAAIGSSPLIRILLDNNSPIDPTDVYGQTPLHHAIAEGHGDAAVTLLKRGAKTDGKDKEGKLAIELAPDRKIRLFVLNAAKAENIAITMPEGIKIDL
jgi:26S proteasome non-ATPase regulatory subunit 10